jgi:hypothetical protein
MSDPGPATAATHLFLGDRWTDPKLRHQPCGTVKRADGRCIRGRNGNILVVLPSGRRVVVPGRRLRKMEGTS